MYPNDIHPLQRGHHRGGRAALNPVPWIRKTQDLANETLPGGAQDQGTSQRTEGAHIPQKVQVMLQILPESYSNIQQKILLLQTPCLLYTSDAADDLTRVDLGGPRPITKKTRETTKS